MTFFVTKNGLAYISIFTIIAFIYSNCFLISFLFPSHNHSVSKSVRKSNKFEIKPSSFIKEMNNFPWNNFQTALHKFNSSQVKSSIFQDLQSCCTRLLLKLDNFLLKSPSTGVNKSCKNILNKNELVNTIVTSNHCIPLKEPRKIGILLQFGFDVDTLEIHLNELNDYVDKFFIIESIKPHSRFLKGKNLLWNLLKFQERFRKFEDKVIHFVVDDANLATSSVDNNTNIWTSENTQEELRWEKFLEWNSRSSFFTQDDLLGFGDVDEITAVDNIVYLKHCQLPSNITSVDIGIWFPFDGLESIFIPDYPVQGHPFTLGDPTFWSLASAQNYYNKSDNKFPSRMRGKSPAFLLGGSHLSRYAYPPYQMAKMLTATETSLESIARVIEIGKLFGSDNYKEAIARLNSLPENLLNRTGSIQHFRSTKYGSEEYENIVKIPEFLNCNRKRYPGFWKQRDSRLYYKYENAE